jgi:hypothetical protein
VRQALRCTIFLRGRINVKQRRIGMAKSEHKEGPITDAKELARIFREGYFASCTWFNDLPPHWQIDIVQIGCKFIDDDGNNDNKGANVRIQGGQNGTLTSTYKGCCRSYIAVSKARAVNGEE